jgi:hypothetical protein
MQPVALLQHHRHPVVALLAGLVGEAFILQQCTALLGAGWTAGLHGAVGSQWQMA